jgi:hypothetical protein
MRSRRQRHGTSAIEFALTLPIPILLLGAVLEYGTFISQREAAVGVARDAARLAAAVPQTDDDTPTADIEETATDKATELLAAYGIPCDSGCSFATQIDRTGTLVTLRLTIKAEYIPLFSLIPSPEAIAVSHTVALEDQ